MGRGGRGVGRAGLGKGIKSRGRIDSDSDYLFVDLLRLLKRASELNRN